jgi:hypothetical protein
MQRETSLQLQEHGRRSQQPGPDARRPGAAAEASRATAVASPGSGAGAADAAATPASSAPRRLRDVHETRHAEEHDDERAQWQDPSHLLLNPQASATILTDRRPALVKSRNEEWILFFPELSWAAAPARPSGCTYTRSGVLTC